MQNTMAKGGGMASWRKKSKLGFREKMKEGTEKRRKITLNKGEKALIMHLFGL